jgi:hypothetical protein
VSYTCLSESEKEYDRSTAVETLKAVMAGSRNARIATRKLPALEHFVRCDDSNTGVCFRGGCAQKAGKQGR